MFNINKYKKSLIAILMAIVLSVAVPMKTQAITINGLTYVSGGTTRYKMGDITSAFNVRGRINGSNSYNFKTTYEYNGVGGYTVDFEVDGNNLALEKISNGQTVTNNGVQLTLVSETTSDGLDVNFNIVNPEGNGDHTYRVAMTADVQLGSNDYAAIYKKNHTGLVVTQDDETKTSDYGAKIYIDFHPDAKTVWLGGYTERIANKYTDGEVSSYTFADEVDTAAAWSWSGEIGDGESDVITTSFNLVEAETTTVQFYNVNGELVEEKEVLVGGAVTLPTLSDPEPGELHVWCENADGTGNCYNGEDTIVVTEEGLTLYEAYIDDPAYLEPVDDSEPVVDFGQNDNVEAAHNEDINITSVYQVDNYIMAEVSSDENQQDMAVPQVSERNDISSETLGKVNPLGVTNKDDGGGIWGILQYIWPYIMSILFLFFIFFILLAKRRKDDDEEEVADGKK